ncbi:MAG: hypothetical protein MJ193_00405 [Clostridia bacterium]|nr:hypothetical protein [Clostridia bacterium]
MQKGKTMANKYHLGEKNSKDTIPIGFFDIDECYKNLANEIVIRACKDYYKLLECRLKGKTPTQGISDSERFFESQLFTLYAGTNIDGEVIKREVERRFHEKLNERLNNNGRS